MMIDAVKSVSTRMTRAQRDQSRVAERWAEAWTVGPSLSCMRLIADDAIEGSVVQRSRWLDILRCIPRDPEILVVLRAPLESVSECQVSREST